MSAQERLEELQKAVLAFLTGKISARELQEAYQKSYELTEEEVDEFLQS